MHPHLEDHDRPGGSIPPTATPRFDQILRLALAAKQLQISEATIRDLRFYAKARRCTDGRTIPGNGFAPAFLKLGRAVYVDIAVFLEIWRAKQSKGASHD